MKIIWGVAPAASGAAKMPLTVLDTTTTVKGTAILW
jgi:hypothetical protein